MEAIVHGCDYCTVFATVSISILTLQFKKLAAELRVTWLSSPLESGNRGRSLSIQERMWLSCS